MMKGYRIVAVIPTVYNVEFGLLNAAIVIIEK